MKYTLVTTAKNEAPYFLEWVAYHRMIGFDRIMIYQNDSDDLTDETLKVLQGIGAIDYFFNRAKTGAHQVRAYKRASRQAAFRKADWVIALDMDEFLTIHAGRGDLDDLIAALPATDAVLLNWRRFGNNRQTRIEDGLVVQRFRSAEPDRRITDWLTPFKTLFRPSHYGRCGIHQPRDPQVDEATIRTVNGSGLPEGEFERFRFRAKDPQCRSLAQINHYITRDAASFVLKSNKGSAHQANRGIDESYWKRRNFNDERDNRLARRADDIQAAMEGLDAQSGGRLSALRTEALALHRERFETLMGDPAYRALYDFCRAP